MQNLYQRLGSASLVAAEHKVKSRVGASMTIVSGASWDWGGNHLAPPMRRHFNSRLPVFDAAAITSFQNECHLQSHTVFGDLTFLYFAF